MLPFEISTETIFQENSATSLISGGPLTKVIVSKNTKFINSVPSSRHLKAWNVRNHMLQPTALNHTLECLEFDLPI